MVIIFLIILNRQILDSLEDEILRVLILAATVSMIIGMCKEGISTGWLDGATIYLAVIIIVSITAGNDYMKEKQFQKLMDVRKKRN